MVDFEARNSGNAIIHANVFLDDDVPTKDDAIYANEPLKAPIHEDGILGPMKRDILVKIRWPPLSQSRFRKKLLHTVRSTKQTLIIHLDSVPNEFDELLNLLIEVRCEAERLRKDVMVFGASKDFKRRLIRLTKVFSELQEAKETAVGENLFQLGNDARIWMQPFGMVASPQPGNEQPDFNDSVQGGKAP